MFASAPPTSGGKADILAIGFGTTVAMWAVGYVCRLPPAVVPSALLGVFMLACMVAGGIVIGRRTARGWRGGLAIGVVSATLNLLILGSLLGGERPNQVVPPALWWIPGSFLAAALTGALGGWIGQALPHRATSPPNWTAAFARVAAGATLLLLIVGGLVTSYEAGLAVVDWPNSFGYNMFLYPLSRMTGGVYYEHAHRLIGSLVGLTTLVLAIHLQRTDTRRWLRRVAWVALAVVMVQGLLGGLRVTGRLTLATTREAVAPSITLAIVHGVLGQVFFGMLVAIGTFVSTTWRSGAAPLPARGAATDRALNMVLVGALVVQLVLGAIVRHIAHGLLIHLSFAVFVILVALTCGVRAWGLYLNQPVVFRLGRALLGLALGQVGLGIAALIVTGATAGLNPRPTVDVLVTTAHQAVGAVLLAWAVMLMLSCHRFLSPPVRATAAH